MPDEELRQDPQSLVIRLPPELLTHIFLQNVLQLPAQRGRYYGLFNFLFVCWRWYNVARSSPILWCHLGRNIHHWPTFIALSKGRDLFVHMYDVYKKYRPLPEDPTDILSRDPDFRSRLRGFTIDGETSPLSHIFPMDSPRSFRLISLSITRLTTETDSPVGRLAALNPRVLHLLVEGSSESLERLSISPCAFDFSQLIIRRLTHLSLTNINSPLTIKKLLFFFQAHPGLEEIRLHFERCQQDVKNQDLPLVSFARLRKLRVTLPTQDVERLFGNMHILSEVEEAEVTMPWFTSLLPDTFRRWFNDVVSPREIQCIEARPVDHSGPGVRYVRGTDSVQHPNLPHHSTFVGLRLRLPEQLDFLSLQVIRNTTRLELFHDDLSASQYLQVFERTPALRELVTWAGRKCMSVRALLPALQDSRIEDEGSETYLPPWVPLSNLSYLRIIEADLREIEDAEGYANDAAILDLVRQRRLLGFGLQRLELVYCVSVRADWLDQLRSFVPEVFWDGRDGPGWIYSADSDSVEDYDPSSAERGDSDEDHRSSSSESEDSDIDIHPSFAESDGNSYPSFTESEGSESDYSNQH